MPHAANVMHGFGGYDIHQCRSESPFQAVARFATCINNAHHGGRGSRDRRPEVPAT